MLDVGVRALSVAFPNTVRTNDWYREHVPEVYAKATERSLATVFKPNLDDPDTALMDQCMAPYLDDPFRGTVERRVLDEGQTSIDLGVEVVTRVLEAGQLDPAELDLLIVVSFWPHYPEAGDGAWIARKLNLRAQVINIEATCSGTMMAIQTAAGMINAGLIRSAVIAVTCTYSTSFDLSDTLCWFMGDGGGGILLGPSRGGEGIESVAAVNTRATCGAFVLDYETDAEGVTHRYMRTGTTINTGRALRANAYRNLTTCTNEALAKAGLELDDIDAFVIHTPVAWFREFAARVWGIDAERIVSLHSQLANIGPALTTTALYYSVDRGVLSPGDRVLIYVFGSVSNSAATIMRWGEVALAPSPF